MSSTAYASRRVVLGDLVSTSVVGSAALVVSGAALIGVLAQVAIPLPFTPVPLTGQTLGVLLVAAALTLGGSVRVGLEDNFYLPDGTMARSNGDLVAKARQLTQDVGRRPATVDEARALLGLGERAAAA